MTEEIDLVHGERRGSLCPGTVMKYGGNELKEVVISGSDGYPVTRLTGRMQKTW
jgi:hypothetical protein